MEDYAKGRKQIDFVVHEGDRNKVVGIECLSKRGTSNLTIQKINDDIKKGQRNLNWNTSVN